MAVNEVVGRASCVRGVIIADYGDAEEKAGRRVCLHLTSGVWES